MSGSGSKAHRFNKSTVEMLACVYETLANGEQRQPRINFNTFETNLMNSYSS